MNIDSSAMYLGINRVAQKCQSRPTVIVVAINSFLGNFLKTLGNFLINLSSLTNCILDHPVDNFFAEFNFYNVSHPVDLFGFEMNAAIIYALCCVPIPFNPISP